MLGGMVLVLLEVCWVVVSRFVRIEVMTSGPYMILAPAGTRVMRLLILSTATALSMTMGGVICGVVSGRWLGIKWWW